MRRHYVGAAVAAVGLVAAAAAGDWPQFRGPAAGVADGPAPVAWGRGRNARWRAEIPGVGWSSPVVVGDKVFVTTATSDRQRKPDGPFGGGFDDPPGGAPPASGGPQRPPDAVVRWHLYCLSADDGAVRWARTAAERKPAHPTFPSNGYASETPAADAARVYAHFAPVGLVVCYDHAGNKVWEKDLGPHPMAMGYGTGSSPAQDAERVFVVCDNEERSFAVALDKATGREVWRKDRPGKSAWSTPLVWTNRVRTEVVCCGHEQVTAYTPDTGDVLWRMNGIDSPFSSTPAADAERVYFGCGGPGSVSPLYAVRAGATGDVTLKKGEAASEWVAWSWTRAGVRVASPLAYRGLLYVAGERGTLSCFDAATGRPAYRNERLPQSRGVMASPWAAGGQVFVLDNSGRTHVVEAGRSFRPVGANTVDEMCWSSPAVAGGRLYLRGRDHLYCFEEQK
jgi:outer membrane protein assembly factor BamB